jgi:hypothetical protein
LRRRKMSKRVKMYKRGPAIRSIAAFERQVKLCRTYFFWGRRPCHMSWAVSLQFHTLRQFVLNGHFFYARKNPKYKELPF